MLHKLYANKVPKIFILKSEKLINECRNGRKHLL